MHRVVNGPADIEADLDRMSNWLNTFDLPGICEADDDYGVKLISVLSLSASFSTHTHSLSHTHTHTHTHCVPQSFAS